ncbi:hypothetical protein ACJ73_03126 [Blastomyces percursus]|uniref:Uncharacterized protein n=1 Tax=Blastomyces percursus TaxID=1658174 RepID=A0A1J9RAF5_9EURO|nr:hypothetical protein ACJ73_03126 [Blastomyces percursus]
MSNILTKDIYGLKLPGPLAILPQPCSIARCYWINHLLVTDLTLFKDEKIYVFLRDHILHWLESLGLLGKVAEGVYLIVTRVTALDSVGLSMTTWMDNGIIRIKFSPAKQLLVSGSLFRTIITLWDPETEKSFATGWSRTGEARNFAPNGQLLATGDRSGVIRLWDVSTKICLANLGRHHAGMIYDIQFLPDGQLFAFTSDDGIVRFWDLASNAPRNYFRVAE